MNVNIHVRGPVVSSNDKEMKVNAVSDKREIIQEKVKSAFGQKLKIKYCKQLLPHNVNVNVKLMYI